MEKLKKLLVPRGATEADKEQFLADLRRLQKESEHIPLLSDSKAAVDYEYKEEPDERE